jgi:hypothetical protein
MPYIIEDYAYIAKRQAELNKKPLADKPTDPENSEDADIDDHLIVGYSGEFYY